MKTTNKVLLSFIIIFTLVITAFVIPEVKNISKVIKDNAPVDLTGITCLEVEGRFRMYTYNGPTYRYWEDTPWADLKSEDLKVERSGDTLRICIKDTNSNVYSVFNKTINLHGMDLKYVKASNGATVNTSWNNQEKITIIANNAAVFINSKKKLSDLDLTVTGNSYIGLDTCKNVNLKMSGEGFVRLICVGGRLTGEMKNRSHIELTGNNNDVKNLIKKDSAAVIYRLSNQGRIYY